MKEQLEPGPELQDESPVAPQSEERDRGPSVIESVDSGIKVRDGQAFEPYRFQEFDFIPAFRDKIMRTRLPLLDLRQLLEDQPGYDNWRHAGPNDITRPANNSRATGGVEFSPDNVAPCSSDPARPPATEPQAGDPSQDGVDAPEHSASKATSVEMQHLVEDRKLHKASNKRLAGKPAKKWKLLLFGGSLVLATFLSLAQSQGPALASTTAVGRFPLIFAHKTQLAQKARSMSLPQPQVAQTQLTEQTAKAAQQSKPTRTPKAVSKPAPKTLWLPAE